MKKETPLGIKIISIIQYVAAVVFVLSGLRSFIVGGALLKAPFLAGVSIIGGIGVVLLGVLYFFVARGMWKTENWARTTTITISVVLGILILITASKGSGDTGGLLGT